MKSCVQKTTSPHWALGVSGEAAAAAFLEKSGYLILGRNWRKGRLELDLICQFKEAIVFVEVKTRSSQKNGGPIGAVTPRKIGNLTRAAAMWLEENGFWEKPCRFDVVCLVKTGPDYVLEHYPNAFEASHALDYSNPPW